MRAQQIIFGVVVGWVVYEYVRMSALEYVRTELPNALRRNIDPNLPGVASALRTEVVSAAVAVVVYRELDRKLPTLLNSGVRI